MASERGGSGADPLLRETGLVLLGCAGAQGLWGLGRALVHDRDSAGLEWMRVSKEKNQEDSSLGDRAEVVPLIQNARRNPFLEQMEA